MKSEKEKAELKDKILLRLASDKPFRDPNIRHLTQEMNLRHDTLAALVKEIEDDGMLTATRHNSNDLYFELDATLYSNLKGRNFLAEGGYTNKLTNAKEREKIIAIKARNQLWIKRAWNTFNTIAIISVGIWQALETSDSKVEEERDSLQEKRILNLEMNLKEMKKSIPSDIIIIDTLKNN